jgi:hypothetical protein
MWSTGYSAHRLREPASTAWRVTFGSGNDGVGWVGGWTRCWVLRKRALSVDLGLRDQRPHHRVVVWFWWARLFFENCTVDASISDETSAWDASPCFWGGVFLCSGFCLCDLF